MAVSINDIWEELSMPLKKFIKKRIPNDQDADDVLQEVFLKILKNSQSLMDDTKVQAWVFRITRNAIVDYYRRRESVELVQLPENLANGSEEDATFNTEIAACLKAMIDNLPQKYKEALLLTEFDNLTQKELSERMEISLSGAKSRVQRGRKLLKDMLLECCRLEFDRAGNVIKYKNKRNDCKFC